MVVVPVEGLALTDWFSCWPGDGFAVSLRLCPPLPQKLLL